MRKIILFSIHCIFLYTMSQKPSALILTQPHSIITFHSPPSKSFCFGTIRYLAASIWWMFKFIRSFIFVYILFFRTHNIDCFWWIICLTPNHPNGLEDLSHIKPRVFFSLFFSPSVYAGVWVSLCLWVSFCVRSFVQGWVFQSVWVEEGVRWLSHHLFMSQALIMILRGGVIGCYSLQFLWIDVEQKLFWSSWRRTPWCVREPIKSANLLSLW